MLTYLEENVNYAVDFFEHNVPQIQAMKPEGTYLIWLDCRALGMRQTNLNDFMIRQAKVGLNDGLRFGSGGEGFLRLNIACPRRILQDALERIAHAVNYLSEHG